MADRPLPIDVRGTFDVDEAAGTVRCAIRVAGDDRACEFVVPLEAVPALVAGLNDLMDHNPDRFPAILHSGFR